MATIPTMVGRVIDRLREVTHNEGLSVTNVRDILDVSYQAAKKIFDGGGIKFDTAERGAKALGCDPHWLMTGKRQEQASPPPPPLSPRFDDNRRLTPAQWEQWQAFSIAATPAEKQAIIERYEMVKQMAERSFNHALRSKDKPKGPAED